MHALPYRNADRLQEALMSAEALPSASGSPFLAVAVWEGDAGDRLQAGAVAHGGDWRVIVLQGPSETGTHLADVVVPVDGDGLGFEWRSVGEPDTLVLCQALDMVAHAARQAAGS